MKDAICLADGTSLDHLLGSVYSDDNAVRSWCLDRPCLVYANWMELEAILESHGAAHSGIITRLRHVCDEIRRDFVELGCWRILKFHIDDPSPCRALGPWYVELVERYRGDIDRFVALQKNDVLSIEYDAVDITARPYATAEGVCYECTWTFLRDGAAVTSLRVTIGSTPQLFATPKDGDELLFLSKDTPHAFANSQCDVIVYFKSGEYFYGTIVEDVGIVPERYCGHDCEMRKLSSTRATAPIARSCGDTVGEEWSGLRIVEAFEPRTMVWNGKSFLIEEPAICYKGHDLENTSLEDYYPELREDWDRHIKDVPFDEVDNLRILRLVSGEKTLLIHVMLRDSVPVYPERLECGGETDGWHEGGVVMVDGQRFEVKGVHVEPTDPKVSAKIDASRRARRPPILSEAGGTGSLGQPDALTGGTTLEAILANIREIKGLASPLPASIASVGKAVERIDQSILAVTSEAMNLRRENADLQELAQGGFLRFATRVEAADFRAFAAIMLTGNRNQAAQVLDIPQRSFYDLVDSWRSRGPDYRRMHRMTDWRKKSGRKIKVRLDDSLLGTEVEGSAENPETIRDVLSSMREKAEDGSRDDLLRDILQAIARQNAQNWQSVQGEVMEILREEVSQ